MQTATVCTRFPSAPAGDSGHERYARCVTLSKHVRWDIGADVIRGRNFDYGHTFLPGSLSNVDEVEFLDAAERRLLSQVQGRSYVNMFGLVEGFIGAKVLQLSGRHWLGDQVALEALVRFSDEELKHQELFLRLEAILAAQMPVGYTTTADPDAVARFVLGKRTWAVLAFILHIELSVQVHYEHSIAPQADLCPLWKDVFMYHWKEGCQHAALDELEWVAEHARIDAAEREAAVDDLVALVGAVDRILQAQAVADTQYFVATSARGFSAAERERIGAAVLRAYRSQYIVSGVEHPHFSRLLGAMTTAGQMERIMTALRRMLLG